MTRMTKLSGLVLGLLALGCGGDPATQNNNNDNQNNQAGFCGDGTVDPGEGCDDGDLNSDSLADACRSDCRVAWCGDGIADGAEPCDDGNASDEDGCLTACADAGDCCVVNVCGDGHQNLLLVAGDPAEACDDGNTVGGDDCRGDCLQDFTKCGNLILDPGEVCDEGGGNSDVIPNRCRSDCRLPTCGDGVTDDDYGELCDDASANDDLLADACRSDCRTPWCGDGVADSADACDDGLSGNSDILADACRTNCAVASCGDTVVDSAELCDEGGANSVLPDADCRPDCQPARCGDGIVDLLAGEACDDASALGGDGCSSLCAVEVNWRCSGAPSSCQCTDYHYGADCGSCRVWVNVDSAIIVRDGRSAATGYATLQPGIDTADASGPGCEVWVVSGDYVIQVSSQSDTVSLRSGVSVYGGFTGVEVAREQRNPMANPTVLDGLNACHHVVTAIDTFDATLSGFVIRDGNANGSASDQYGGGIYLSGGDVSVDNCRLHGHFADRTGGAVELWAGAVARFTNCIFHNNLSVQQGGALAVVWGSASVTNSTFHNNFTFAPDSGDLHLGNGSDLQVTNSILWGAAPDVTSSTGIAMTYSNVEGGFTGLGNIDADPRFRDATNFDFSLRPDSPCIDEGADATAPALDAAKQTRLDIWNLSGDVGTPGTLADMGALEYYPLDCDLSGWSLQQAFSSQTYNFQPGVVVPGGGLLIIARESTRADFEQYWQVSLAPSIVYLNSFGNMPLINGDETYDLQDSFGTTIDGVTVPMVSGQSIQRVDLLGLAMQESSWLRTIDASATPGTTGLPLVGVNPVISEFSDSSGMGNYYYEFVELYCPDR